jgi:hypothetical protein
VKINDFTDTLYIELRRADITDASDPVAAGQGCTIALEQAAARARIPVNSHELVAA